MAGKKSRRTKKRSKAGKKTKALKLFHIEKEVEETFYLCVVCKKRFRQESTFQLHCLIHKNEQTFSCNICKKEFPCVSRLQKHCLLQHSNDLLVVGQESNQVGSTSTKPFQCSLCNKGFLGRYTLKKHLSYVHERNYNEEELHQSLTSKQNSCKRSTDFYSKKDYSRVHKDTNESKELCIKKESDASCDISLDSEKVCDTLRDDGLSCKKTNRALRSKCQDSPNDFSQVHVKPGRSTELCIKMESDSFDTKDSLWSERKSSCDKGSADSTGPLDERANPKTQFFCSMCNMRFFRRCDMQSHFHTHEPKQANYTPRFTCDQPLPSQPSNALSVLNIGPYLCDICHKRFVKNEDFQKHFLMHSEQNMYTCKVCSKQFACYGNFMAHCETHMKKNGFYCNFCGTNFRFQKNLIDHQQMQSPNAKLQCQFCNEKFDHACSLIIHEQTHKGYPCEDCGSVFSVAAALKRHQRSHANEIKCGVCAKTFATNNLLQQHLETHFGSELHRCEVCNEEFEFNHHLHIHRTTHQGDMPHTCQLCNKGFLYAWLLRNHLLEHEDNQDAEMWQNCSLDTEENELPGKVTIKEMSESYEGNLEKIIKKEKDC